MPKTDASWINYGHWIPYANLISSNDANYLINNFEVDITYSFKDKWENGEVIYLFTTNRKFITQ